jgi:hypothetical protein
MLTAQRLLDTVSVTADIEDAAVSISFITPDDQSDIQDTNNTIGFSIQGKTNVFCYTANNSFVITFQKADTKTQVAHIKVAGATMRNMQSSLHISQSDKTWIARIQGGAIRRNGDRFMLILNDEVVHLIIEPYAEDEMISAFGVNPSSVNIIQADESPIEFSISVYDDPNRKILRHVRYGVPVVSTVPVSGSGLTNTQEAIYVKQMIEEGVGTKFRTMYFRVFSSRNLGSTTPPHLYIFLPNGLDTVSNPVVIPLTAETLSSPNFNQDYSVFIGEYDFYREDTAKFVDGFAYLGVYLQPTKVYSGLPLIVKTNASGARFSLSSFDDPWKY